MARVLSVCETSASGAACGTFLVVACTWPLAAKLGQPAIRLPLGLACGLGGSWAGTQALTARAELLL